MRFAISAPRSSPARLATSALRATDPPESAHVINMRIDPKWGPAWPFDRQSVLVPCVAQRIKLKWTECEARKQDLLDWRQLCLSVSICGRQTFRLVGLRISGG